MPSVETSVAVATPPTTAARITNGSASDGRAIANSRATVFQTEQSQPGVAVIQTNPWPGIPSPIVYQKGAWVLQMLRAQIGDEKFWLGIREYYRRYRDANACTADFRKVMEEAAGLDLAWFFDQWLTRPGSPALEGAWTYDAAAKQK